MFDLDFFSSPIGLGHVTRDMAIASNFENISTKFVTGNGAAKILKNLDFRVEDVYIPPQFIVENGMLKNYWKNLKFSMFLSLLRPFLSPKWWLNPCGPIHLHEAKIGIWKLNLGI